MMTAANDVDTQTRRAYKLFRAGQLKEAAALLIETVKAHPISAPPYKLLADVERSLGNRAAEAAVLQEIISLDPLNADTWRRLASVQAERGRSDEAYRAYRRATQLKPTEASGWEGLISSALSAQRLEHAQAASKELLDRFPGRASSHLFAGHIQKALGCFDRARAAYEAALNLSPGLSEAIYNLVDLQPPPPDGPLNVRATALLEGKDVDDADSANLNFAVARVFETAKQFNRAFSHYEKANAAVTRVMRARDIIYRPGDVEESVQRTLETYPEGSFCRPLDPLPIEFRPIFIVGMPRSGTSVIEQILSSHPSVTAGGELTIASECEEYYAQRRTELGLSGAIDVQNERERTLLEEIREHYLDNLFERGLGGDYITEKLPGNFARLGFVRLLFPEAVIIHSTRDPIATCWSLFASNFGQHSPYYNSLDHLSHFYGCYRRLMAHWESVLSPPLTHIHYEKLILTPEEEIRRLVKGAGLDWDDRCMAFYENQRPVLTASYGQVRMPLYTGSLDRWRPFASRLSALDNLKMEERALLSAERQPMGAGL